MTTELQFYDAAKAALAKAVKVDEVKKIHDKAAAVKAAARIAMDKTLEADAAEIRMRAERRLGQLMEQQKQTVGFNKGGKSEHRNRVKTKPGKVTLTEAGIDKNLAQQARTAAKPSDQEFESKVAAEKEYITAPKPVTVSEKPKPKKPATPRRRVPAADSKPPSVSAEDIALKRFTTVAAGLVQLTRNRSAERFAKTALPDEGIRQLAKLFSDLAKIRCSGLTRHHPLRSLSSSARPSAPHLIRGRHEALPGLLRDHQSHRWHNCAGRR